MHRILLAIAVLASVPTAVHAVDVNASERQVRHELGMLPYPMFNT